MTATVSGASGVKDLYVVTSANSFLTTPTPDTDATDYAFGFQALTHGATPSGSYTFPVAGSQPITAYRKIGEADWDGAAITGIRQLTGAQATTATATPTAALPAITPVTAVGATSQTAPLYRGRIGLTGSDVFSVSAAGGVDGTAYSVAGVALAASHLSNGASGTGAVALVNSPTFITPTLGVASATSLTLSGALAGATTGAFSSNVTVGGTLGVTGTTTVATLAATTFSGTPNFSGAATGQTAAVDTNTTQLATTAFVVGQGYLKSATAGATYQPLDSDLTAIAAMSATGIPVQTAVGTWAQRTITGTAGQITVTNGDGVAGNPTVSLPATITQATTFSAASTALSVTNNATVGGTLGVTGIATFTPATTATSGIQVKVTGESRARLNIVGDGTLYWSDGTAIADTKLYRSAASTLTTDGHFGIGINATVGGTLGVTGATTLAGISATTGAFSSNVTVGGTLTGMTNVTGTGSFVLAAAPTLTGTTTVATLAATTFSGTPNFSGAATGQTAAVDTNTTQLATTAFVLGQAAAATPVMDGVAAVGTSTRYARADHVHATDTSRAPLASPTFTGTPAAPTAAVDTNTTQLATTAYVVGQGYAKLAGPTFTGTVTVATLAATTINGAALSGTFTGAATFSGSITLSAAATALTVTNNATISGTATIGTAAITTLSGTPNFSGAATGQTAAVDTNTTQLATTAFVIGQGYAKLAGPTFTGTTTAATFKVTGNTTMGTTNAATRLLTLDAAASAYQSFNVAGVEKFVVGWENANTRFMFFNGTAYVGYISSAGLFTIGGTYQTTYQLEVQGTSHFTGAATFSSTAAVTSTMTVGTVGTLVGGIIQVYSTDNTAVVGGRASSGTYTGSVFHGIVDRADSTAFTFIDANNNSGLRFYVDGTGVVHSTSTSITSISDERLKENIVDLPDPLSVICGLRPVEFDWKKRGPKKGHDRGFIAQEVKKVLPHAVAETRLGHERHQGMLGVAPSEFIPYLVGAVQQLSERIAKLEAAT